MGFSSGSGGSSFALELVNAGSFFVTKRSNSMLILVAGVLILLAELYQMNNSEAVTFQGDVSGGQARCVRTQERECS